MNHRTSILRRRDLRAYVAAFISYIMLAGQVAPLALAAAPRHVPAPAAAPASSSKAAAAPAALAFAAPNIVATKQDSWDDTGTPDGKAEPGQVVTYTVTVSNTGDADATNVQFNDSVDANTTLVPGSVDVQAVTTNDAYNVIGNVRIQPNAAQGLLANDNPFGGTVSGPTTTAQGGNLTVNSDGSFSYNPPPGFTGTDSFTYTVTSAGGKTDTATAELKVGDGNGGTAGPAIWFVNASAPAGGDGRLTNPYNCFRGTSVPAVQTCFSDSAPDDPGDAIFIFSGSYTSGYALLAGEKLFGQGMTVTLAAAAAVTVPAYSDALPTTGGANPVLSSGSLTDNIVVSAGNNTIRGVTLANSGGVAGDSSDISGSNFGTLTVAEVELNGTGRALNLSNGTLAAAFTGITVTASTGQGLSLATVGGTLTTAGGTTVSGNLAQCILVNTSTADINFGNTSCAGGTDGVSLQNNSAGTRTFGTLTRSGGSGVGFLHANGGGAVNVTGATSITNTAGTGVSIANSNANISFAATSVDKGANAGACVSITSNATRTTTFLSLDLNSTNASGVGLFSTTGGTINVTNAAGSEITAPQLIDINVATLGLNFNLLSSTNGPAATPALRVIGAGGSLNSGSTTVQNPGSSGLSLDGNSAAFSFGNTAVIASAATGVFLNNNSGGVTFADLDIAPDSSQPALHATNNAGAITTSSGDVDATGSVALDITGASAAARTPLALALTRVESTDSASASGGVNLNFVSGSLSVSNPSGVDTNVSNPNSFGIRVRNSTGTLNFGDTSVAGSGGTGVILGTSGSAPEGGNTGGVTFADLDITPDSGQRALLSQQSTGTITTTSGTVSTTNNVAVEIAGQAAGTRTPLNVQWTSVSALASGGNPANGIILTNTSAAGSPGGFRVLGTGGTCTFSTPTCTGGRITSTAGAEDGTPEDNAGIGVRLNSADQVFLTRMRIDNHANFAVAGKNVVGFNLDASLIDGANGTNAAFDEGAIQFRELTGTSAAGTASSITNSFIGGGREFLIDVRNFAGGTLDRLTISNNTVGDLDGAGAGFGLHVSDGDDAIHLEGFGSTATFRATVSNNVVNSARGDLVNFNVGTTGNNITSDFVMRGNTLANTHTAVLSGGGGSTITMGGGATINSTYDISCNRITGSKGFGLLVAKTLGSGTAQGTIFNNRIGTPGVAGSASSEAAGMDVDSRGSGTHTVLIKNNVVTDWGANGAYQIFNNQGSVTMNVTVQGNLSDNPHPTNGLAGFYAEVGALAGDTSVLNLLVGGAGAAENNFVDGDPFNGTDVLLSRIAGAGTSLNLSRGVSAASSVQQIITDNNVDPVTAAGAGTITFVNTVPALPPATDQTCSAPSAPLNMDVTDDFVGVLGVPTQASLEAPSGGVTSRPFVSPRPTARKATAPVATAAQARTTTTRPAAQGNVLGREAAPATKKAASTGVPTEPIVVMGAGGNVSVNIGTLRAGDSVTITFRVTIDNPYSGPPAVSNQGTVTADGGISVLTDDPTEAGSNNPTVTPVNSLNIFARDGEASEPTSGTTPLLFTVTLSSPAPLGGVAVNYTTADGGATPATGGASCGGAVDYETKAGTLSFAAGERVKTVSVNVCADNAAGESDETLLLNLSGATGGNVQVAQATGTITQGTTPGTFLISELRTSGPAGSNDEFVELYNNTDTPLTVAASDATAGYGVFTTGGSCDATPVLVGTIPNGTVIPARGHYLMVGTAYSLANYGGTGAAAGDLTMSSDLPNDGNVAVFTTADVGNISSSARLDAVGFGTNTGGGVCDLLREGNTLSPVAGSTTEHSFFRQQCDYVNGVGCTVPGNPKDTNDNAADFLFADTQGSTITGVTQRLGAPGPENLASPIRRDNTGLNAGLLDSTKPSSAEPNRHREIASGTNATFGTLSIRRRVTNNTGSPVTRLRFRIVELTTFPSPGNGQADLRALSSSSVSVSSVNDPATCPPGTTPCTVTVQGTTLETPPSQPEGGGYNSTLAAGTVTTAAPLAPGASINLQFVLGIETTGKFRFYIIVEALP